MVSLSLCQTNRSVLSISFSQMITMIYNKEKDVFLLRYPSRFALSRKPHLNPFCLLILTLGHPNLTNFAGLLRTNSNFFQVRSFPATDCSPQMNLHEVLDLQEARPFCLGSVSDMHLKCMEGRFHRYLGSFPALRPVSCI